MKKETQELGGEREVSSERGSIQFHEGKVNVDLSDLTKHVELEHILGSVVDELTVKQAEDLLILPEGGSMDVGNISIGYYQGAYYIERQRFTD